MIQSYPLSEYEESVLRLIQSMPLTKREIIEEFNKVLTKIELNDILNNLQTRKYIKIEQTLVIASIYLSNESSDKAVYEYNFVLTPLGKNYLAGVTSNFTSFSNITNSNIANHSQNTRQSIKVSDLDIDTQQKIKELELAILKKDNGEIKKVFGYIADKSVDVAIAILVGGLLK